MVDWNLVSNDVVNWSAIQTISNAILASGLIVITAYYAYQTNKQVKLMKETREYELMKEKRQFRSDNLQRQLHIYSKLMGLIFTTTQIYDFHGYYYISYKWQEARVRLNLEGLPDSRSWVEAAQRVDNYIRKSDDLILEMAKNNQTLWETMGLIRFLFTPSIELDVHLKEVEQILTSTQPRIAVIESEFKTVEGKDVDSLKNETYRDFNALISEHIDKPMENLAKYLKQEVDAEAAKIRVLWTNSENILKNPQYCRDCKLFCSTKTCPLKPPSQEEIKKKG